MDLVIVARLRRPRGNKGELIGDSLTSFPERFEKLQRVFLVSSDGSRREASVEKVWMFRGEPVFLFAGIDSISAAEAVAGWDVCVPAAERVTLGDGEYFFSDIVGCSVTDSAGLPIGRVTGWQEGPAQVLMEIEDVAGGEFLVPFVGAIFQKIDVASKAVVVDLPEGLREMNR